jgi:hypothetical protein
VEEQVVPCNDTKGQCANVYKEVSVVIYGNAIVHPRAMTASISYQLREDGRENSLIVLCYTSIAHFTMLTSHGPSNHTSDTEMLFIKLS